MADGGNNGGWSHGGGNNGGGNSGGGWNNGGGNGGGQGYGGWNTPEAPYAIVFPFIVGAAAFLVYRRKRARV